MPWCGGQRLDHEENAETGKSKRFTIERKNKETLSRRYRCCALCSSIAFYVVRKTSHSPRRFEGNGFAMVISNKLKKNFCVEKRKGS